jgi:hypothetical protein
MEALLIERTEDTPKILFEPEKGNFEISSRSLPEDSSTFYTPVAEWLQSYIKSPREESNFTFHFEYISTSSTKQIMKIFMLINELSKSKKVNVFWKYDRNDEDMMQTGKRMQKLTNIEFRYVEV